MGYLDDDRVILHRASIDKTGARRYGKKANVPENYVVELQEDLLQLGFDSGSADGFFGGRTDEAVRAFQEAALSNKRTRDGRLITVSPSYRGEMHGECDGETRKEIRIWKENDYRSVWPLSPIWIGPEEPLKENRIEFAEPSSSALFWPIRTRDRGGREVAYKGVSDRIFGSPGRRFLATRSNQRYHVGVDLWGRAGDCIVACEDGEIVNHYHFYNGVHALIVQCDSGLVINYGEVKKDSWRELGLDIGSRVKGGQPIAVVGQMVNDSMCHFECYREGTKQNHRYYMGKQPPSALLNPTKYLLHLAAKDYPTQVDRQPESVLPPPPPPPAIPDVEDVSGSEQPAVAPGRLPNFSGLDRFHEAFPGGVQWRLTPKGVELQGSGIERTPGKPSTVRGFGKTSRTASTDGRSISEFRAF